MVGVAATSGDHPAEHPGADTGRVGLGDVGYVLIYELVIGLPITAIGVLIGRMSRGRGAIVDRDPWR